ncbi:hypothetical protein G8759_28530 [Spirosoma aureum]|uniref:T9SS type A sorting domain-containing protein n=1 Tax=Spirosoma aureum TaxID=2692134 RepID=A0A6G9AVB4_9BACT|nr:hypothetical protein [Spirosoma aureum]QIP16308.1 hypothetical protein G8759_28530 [Spirosoma aureum]
MKTRLFPSNRYWYSSIGRALFGLLLLASPSLYAQTFAGNPFLTTDPVSFRAIIIPDKNRSAINVRVEKQNAKALRIRLFSVKSKEIVYDNYVTKNKFFGRFDMSTLPYGVYAIELSTQSAKQTEIFRIEPSSSDRIVLVTKPLERDSLLAQY